MLNTVFWAQFYQWSSPSSSGSSRPGTTIWAEGCADPESDGAGLCRTAGAFRRNGDLRLALQLGQDIPLVIALCVSIVGLYGAVLLLCRIDFALTDEFSALAALTAAAPAVPFVGPAILGDLFGSSVPFQSRSPVWRSTLRWCQPRFSCSH